MEADVYGECVRSSFLFIHLWTLSFGIEIFLAKLGDVMNNGDAYAYEVDNLGY